MLKRKRGGAHTHGDPLTHEYPKSAHLELDDFGVCALVVKVNGSNIHRNFRVLLTRKQLENLVVDAQEALAAVA